MPTHEKTREEIGAEEEREKGKAPPAPADANPRGEKTALDKRKRPFE